MNSLSRQSVPFSVKVHRELGSVHRPIPKGRLPQPPSQIFHGAEVGSCVDELVDRGGIGPRRKMIERETNKISSRSISDDAWCTPQLILNANSISHEPRKHSYPVEPHETEQRNVPATRLNMRYFMPPEGQYHVAPIG